MPEYFSDFLDSGAEWTNDTKVQPDTFKTANHFPVIESPSKKGSPAGHAPEISARKGVHVLASTQLE